MVAFVRPQRLLSSRVTSNKREREGRASESREYQHMPQRRMRFCLDYSAGTPAQSLCFSCAWLFSFWLSCFIYSVKKHTLACKRRTSLHTPNYPTLCRQKIKRDLLKVDVQQVKDVGVLAVRRDCFGVRETSGLLSLLM